MPKQKTILENYWGTCYKRIGRINIPYLCKKQRNSIEYCYTFDWYWHIKILFICYHTGCENNIKYKWTGFCNSVFWYSYKTNYNLCTTKKFDISGNC